MTLSPPRLASRVKQKPRERWGSDSVTDITTVVVPLPDYRSGQPRFVIGKEHDQA
jgi:hypothetical protein